MTPESLEAIRFDKTTSPALCLIVIISLSLLMSEFYGYIRVSTAKQGESGVSLHQQRDAILEYARKNQLEVKEWFTEQMSAAKKDRPVFSEMLKQLKKGRAHGVIMHKIDRSARNLKDWANLGDLIDNGIEMHFANESLDLRSRGGRLSADIQAVVAADYIRNLKEEALKGFYGRLKQGVYPMPAPVGYLDEGKGNPKSLDPIKAPLVRKVFELYSTGSYSIDRLLEMLPDLGLTSRKNTAITRSALAGMLHNPFYMGLIHIKKTGETFRGSHPPLISKSLFDRVQAVLEGKAVQKVRSHDFLFRKLLQCKHCGHRLSGERQKGINYYRCHTKSCPTKCIKEDDIDLELQRILSRIQLTDDEMECFSTYLQRLRVDWEIESQSQVKATELQLNQAKERLNRLTDAYLDREIEKELFLQRKDQLLKDIKDLEEKSKRLTRDASDLPDKTAKFFELLNSLYLTYISGTLDEKRKIVEIVTSNRLVDGKNPLFTLKIPYADLEKRPKMTSGGPQRDKFRTRRQICGQLWEIIISTIQNGSDPLSNVPKVPEVRKCLG